VSLKVVVIGCGPSGLLAAHACRRLGVTPRIVSDRVQQSQLGGAMYLHRPIPGLIDMEPSGRLLIKKIGSKEGYAKKVYGSPDHPVSWDLFHEGATDMWSLREAYKTAWQQNESYIEQMGVGPVELGQLVIRNDLVINTAPKPYFCHHSHTFKEQRIWIRQVSDYDGDCSAVDTMVYNGLWYDPWYRMSLIERELSYEYATEPPFKGCVPGRKPISNDCYCWPEVMWAGRFGSWGKGVLTHHVYEEVTSALYEML
jgi:hypothetical protein